MKIWVDADACPKLIKDILFRAANRRKITLILVANQPLLRPPSQYIRSLQVGRGFDVADAEIVAQVVPGDLVITADIPLAALVVAKGGLVLDPRGACYTTQNIQERLAVRNLMQELRESRQVRGGPAALTAQNLKEFSDALDRLLTKHCQIKGVE